VLLTSGYHGDFEIPNNPGQTPQFTDMGRSTFNSAKLNETQVEQDAYAILAYQKKIDDFNMQASVFTLIVRYCFGPIIPAILFSTALHHALSRHFLEWSRVGCELQTQRSTHAPRRIPYKRAACHLGTSTLVFPVDANGNQTSDIPLRIVDNSGKYGYFYGVYLQMNINLSNNSQSISAAASTSWTRSRMKTSLARGLTLFGSH